MTSPSNIVAVVAGSDSFPMSISLGALISQAASDLAGQVMDSNTLVPPAQAKPLYSFICSPEFRIALVAASTVASVDLADTEEVDSCEVPNSSTDDAPKPAPKPTTFTLFPKLPFEIRCMVWAAALPDGEKVKGISLLKYQPRSGGTSQQIRDYADQINQWVVMPIAFCINQESRNETLRHYYILPATLSDPTIKVAPYVFSRVHPVALIEFSSFINIRNDLNVKDHSWLSGMSIKDMKSCFSQIKWLWIDLDGSYRTVKGVFAPFNLHSGHSSHEHQDRKMEDPWCCCFHLFPALEQVVFSINHAQETQLCNVAARHRFFDSAKKILESHAASFNSGKLPELCLSNKLLDGTIHNEGGFAIVPREDGGEIVGYGDDDEEEEDDGDDDDNEDDDN
ncbi:hypothetical protein IFR05_006131 [Cadophora sp. M221]|nr:hypothetical protein IFR05_006131 [Cadophora sp. M221]